MGLGKEIEDWILLQMSQEVERDDCAVSKSFHTIHMKDGRNAQIQVTLELDEEEWWE